MNARQIAHYVSHNIKTFGIVPVLSDAGYQFYLSHCGEAESSAI